jgi:cytoskeletal protein CcmA (bactofilin family)
MFSSTKRSDVNDMGHQNSQGSATIIAHGVRVEGNFVSQGDVTVEGDVEGKVSASGVLTVGSDAKLKARDTSMGRSLWQND